jgi:methionine-rich copper-binding protein CopC
MRIFISVGIALALFAVGPASAHAMLEHASPSAGAALHESPKSVVLSYSEPLEPALSTIAVTDSQGHDVTAAKATADGTTMSVALKPLKPGDYHVRWHALSVDTHRTDGAFAFTVAP